MASCDDGFPLLPDDHHQQQQQQQQPQSQFQHQGFYRPNRFVPKVAAALPAIIRSPIGSGRGDGGEGFTDPNFGSKCASSFPDVVPYSGNEEGSPYAEEGDRRSGRKEREEVSDGGTPYLSKRSKIGRGGSGSGSGTPGGGDYRKDREEWSDAAIECLLEAYMDKYAQLNWGNLRGRDWEEVAGMVKERCQKQSKSVEQCKNKVDNLKKRYKLEKHRMSSSGVTTSHWPWFKKMEEIYENSLLQKRVGFAEDKIVESSTRQSKRYIVPASMAIQPVSTKAKQAPRLRWHRVVFKISGVALAGSGSDNFDPKVATLIASEVSKACRVGVEVAIVLGGRNLFCGDSWVTATGTDRSTAYHIGMMATVMNSILLQSALDKLGIQARVLSGITVQESVEPYNRQRAIRHLEKGRVVIFGGVGVGTGNPLFSTDTAAALRASEINAEAVLKGTNAAGLYDSGSISNNVFEHITFRELGSRGANFMDMMALTYCEENSIPVVVFNLLGPGNISRAICGEPVGTLIDQAGRIS